MHKKAFVCHLFVTISLVMILAGCAVTLAPAYNKSLIDGLIIMNTQSMEFFACVSQGTIKDTYSERKDKYNALIGKSDALIIQAMSRPQPNNETMKKIKEIMCKQVKCVEGKDLSSTVTALKMISENLVKMQNTDQKQGLTDTEVALFKNGISIYLVNALMYENVLERL